ncbi:hypothetical protein KFK09_002739 [Dendrobium nobile]|uniref:DUF4283 domain-containing protein n=1 Tax=Dendrobium nobile TaxID=94219 RepID=A0A8T3C272_DENNO|nr:hypothetical protein KFK09_002739 [Dendrobium nobile]
MVADLDVGVESPVIPIWVAFPSLRPHLFAPRILHALASMFGRPLKVDNSTSVGSRPSLARVLVEIDITKDFPDKIWLGSENSGYVQRVCFEEVPAYCVVCKRLGHFKGDCGNFSASLNVHKSCENVVKPVDEAQVASDLPDLGDGPLPVCGNSEILESLVTSNPSVVVDVVNVVNDVPSSRVGNCSVLSPDAAPFVPLVVTDVSDHGSPVVVPEVVFDAMNVVYSDGSPVMGVVNSNGGVQGLKDVDGGSDSVLPVAVVPAEIEKGREEVNLITNSLVVVPVSVVDSQVMANCVGNSSGLDIRNQNNCLVDSSDVESDSQSVESDNDFTLVRTSNVGSRGKFWGKGRRRR